MEPFHLTTIGRFEFARGGRRFAIRAPKHCGLLAYLATHPRQRVSRHELADLLWGAAGEEHARVSLRQALAAVRSVLEEHFDGLIDADGGEIQLKPGVCSVDSLALERGEIVDSRLLIPERAVSAEFLAGLHIASEPFEEWLGPMRSRIGAALSAVIDREILRAQQAGDDEEALAAAQRGLIVDPLQEHVHAAVISALARLGRRGLAHEHREHAVALFQRELGVRVSFDAAERASPVAPPAPGAADVRPMLDIEPSPAGGDWGVPLAEAIRVHLAGSIWMQVSTVRADARADGRGPARARRHRLEIAIEPGGRRTTLRLVRAADHALLWSDTVAFDPADDTSLEFVALAFAARTEGVLMGAESSRCRGASESADPWERVMRAYWLFWRTSRANNREAAAVLDQVIAADPMDCRALAMRAFVWNLDAVSAWADDVPQALIEARRAARRAVRCERNAPWPLFALANAEAAAGDLDAAERTMREAIALGPALASAHGELGRILACKGDRAGASQACDRALALSPRDPHAGLWYWSKGLAAFAVKDYAAAREQAIAAAAVRGEWFHNGMLHAVCTYRLGHAEDAAARLASALRLTPGYGLAALRAGHPFASAETLDDFIDALKRLGWAGASAGTTA